MRRKFPNSAMGRHRGQRQRGAQRLILETLLQPVGDAHRRDAHQFGHVVASEPTLLPGVFHFRGNVPPAEATELLDMVEAAFIPSEAPGCEECPPCDEEHMQWWSCRRCRTRRSRKTTTPPWGLCEEAAA